MVARIPFLLSAQLLPYFLQFCNLVDKQMVVGKLTLFEAVYASLDIETISELSEIWLRYDIREVI